jgi:hypothetical protein
MIKASDGYFYTCFSVTYPLNDWATTSFIPFKALGADYIWKFNETGTVATTFFQTPTRGTTPASLDVIIDIIEPDWDQGYLYAFDGNGRYEYNTKMYKIDIETGTVVRTVDCPGKFHGGISCTSTSVGTTEYKLMGIMDVGGTNTYCYYQPFYNPTGWYQRSPPAGYTFDLGWTQHVEHATTYWHSNADTNWLSLTTATSDKFGGIGYYVGPQLYMYTINFDWVTPDNTPENNIFTYTDFPSPVFWRASQYGDGFDVYYTTINGLNDTYKGQTFPYGDGFLSDEVYGKFISFGDPEKVHFICSSRAYIPVGEGAAAYSNQFIAEYTAPTTWVLDTPLIQDFLDICDIWVDPTNSASIYGVYYHPATSQIGRTFHVEEYGGMPEVGDTCMVVSGDNGIPVIRVSPQCEVGDTVGIWQSSE